MPYDDARATRLIAAMGDEIARRYGDGGLSPAAAQEFSTPGVFLLVELDGVAVGCGGVRPRGDDEGELKRMYVEPAVRGRGLARALLTALVDHARDAGMVRPAARDRHRAAGGDRALRGRRLDAGAGLRPLRLRPPHPLLRARPVTVFAERGSGAGLLVRLGFQDTAATGTALVALGVWRDGRPVDEDAAALVTAAADAADPDLAVSALARLLAAVDDPDALRAAVRGQEGLRARLLGVLGTSVALGDHLVAHPADWHALADDALLDVRPSVYGLQAALLRAVDAPVDEPLPWGTGGARSTLPVGQAVERLRAAYRRQVLELAARDVVGAVALEDVGGELADLAGATLSAAMAVALTTLPDGAAPCRLAVLGMGKAGGRELNYVSDVDVVFVGEPAGAGRRRRGGAAHRHPPGRRDSCASAGWSPGRSTPDCGRRGRPGRWSAPWPATPPTTAAGRRPGSSRRCSRRVRWPGTWRSATTTRP